MSGTIPFLINLFVQIRKPEALRMHTLETPYNPSPLPIPKRPL